jgi:hypothetical protein
MASAPPPSTTRTVIMDGSALEMVLEGGKWIIVSVKAA